MEIVVRGRNVEVPEHFRQHVEDKVAQSDKFDGKLKILRIDVELFHEKNPRQSQNCQRVEITLRGKVLPIGGIKEKVLAAHRAGLKEVVLPKRNEGDLEDVPEQVREQITFHVAESINDVLSWALEKNGTTENVA